METTHTSRSLPLTLLGNLFEHYDKALYGLLAPFIAPLFFPKSSYLVSLILAYLPYSLVLQPIAFFLLRRKRSYKNILLFALLGMSLSTLMIGLTPTFEQVGIVSPIALALARALQGLFSSIEASAAPLVVLERVQPHRRNLASTLYEISSQGGVVIASLFVALFASFGIVKEGWRLLFLLGGTLGTAGLFLRYRHLPDIPTQPPPKISKADCIPICRIAVMTGFICVNYLFVMQLTNATVPLTSHLTLKTMMWIHFALSVSDLFLLPLFGLCMERIGRDRLMLTCTLAIALLSPLLFGPFDNTSIEKVMAVRFLFVCLGLGLASGYQNWCRDCACESNQFFIIGVGKMIGKKCFSDPAIALSLLIFHQTFQICSVAIYLSCMAILSSAVIFNFQKVFVKIK